METVLIGESSAEFCRSLKQQLKKECRVLTAKDGDGVRRILEGEKTDLLILDLHLPGLDPVGFLRELRDRGTMPGVLALTRFLSGYLAEALAQLGVSYLLVRPCMPETVADRARELLRRGTASDSGEDRLRKLLLRFSIPVNLSGGQYLLSAIPRMEKNSSQALTKELYPAVGREFGVDWTLVERSIRHAITLGWDRGDRALWLRYFPGGKPKNGEFIACMAELDQTPGEFPYDTWRKWESCG